VLTGLVGFDMCQKTAGVVGTGKIGKCAAKILAGFGCRVVAFDKFKDEKFAESIGMEYLELNELFAQSDIISLHVPLLPDTHHMINAESIEKMKDGVMIVNTGRGALIDTVSLIGGLKSGKIGYAGLDVYEEEGDYFFEDLSNKVIGDDVLARLTTFNNVIITSHQAFLTEEALAAIASTTFNNIDEFLAGKRGSELTNSVNI
jgi:D-lactate dehydrogenase